MITLGTNPAGPAGPSPSGPAGPHPSGPAGPKPTGPAGPGPGPTPKPPPKVGGDFLAVALLGVLLAAFCVVLGLTVSAMVLP